MCDRLIASDLSYLVLQKRNREMQLQSTPLHESHQPLQACVFDATAADRPAIRDSYQGDVIPLERETPTWAWHGRKR